MDRQETSEPIVEPTTNDDDHWQDWRMLTAHIPAEDSQDSPGFVLGYN